MIFDTIRLVGPTNVISLPLRGAQPTDPYIVKDVDGLGPSEVMVNIKPTLTRGGIMQSLRPQNKHLDLLIKLNPNYNLGQRPDTLRDAIYTFLAPIMNRAIELQLVYENNVIGSIQGYLGRIIPNPFSKDPEIQVGMPCLQPYFSAPTTVQVGSDGSLATAAQEFSFMVKGTAPTPAAFSFQYSSGISNLAKVHHKGYSGPGQVFTVPHTFAQGTSLAVNGFPGGRYVRQDIPGQSSVNLIGKIGVGSIWLDLYPGQNTIVFDRIGFLEYMDYVPKFQGV